MGHALANTVLQFGIARAFLGLGESGNFPAAIKTIAEWFPQIERSLATGIFNSGANVGAILAPLIVPWVTIHYGWHCGLPRHRHLQRLVDPPLVPQVPQAHSTIPHSPPPNSTTSTREARRADRPLHTVDQVCSAIARPGHSPRQVPHRSHLVVLPLLAALLLQRRNSISICSHLGLPLIIVYNCITVGSVGGGWLPASFRQAGTVGQQGAPGRHALCACLVVPIFSSATHDSEWARQSPCSARRRSAPGLVGKSLHHVHRICSRAAPLARSPASAAWPDRSAASCFATYSGHILQMTHSYATLFIIAASAYLAGTGSHSPARTRTEES